LGKRFAKERTDYCLLYLHGFSASWYEGYPANVEFAKHFGMNAYLPRLASHGLETEDALIDMTPDNLWESAKEALMVARSLGKKVIIMSTSTGGTLGLQLAADFPEYVDGLILYSPNIRINNGAAFLLSNPGACKLAESYRRKIPGYQRRFRIERLSVLVLQIPDGSGGFLQQLVDVTMNKPTFNRVTVPVFLGYYFKDEKQPG
jgi:pimeloyl-ACP methyl ester carboxylesterase